MPDALAKTIPIWCAVINRLVFPDVMDKMELLTPHNVVGRSEHAQIDAKLDGFVRDAEVSGI
jgi:tRNA A64-2'-O-ribosylphosphate transferase